MSQRDPETQRKVQRAAWVLYWRGMRLGILIGGVALAVSKLEPFASRSLGVWTWPVLAVLTIVVLLDLRDQRRIR